MFKFSMFSNASSLRFNGPAVALMMVELCDKVIQFEGWRFEPRAEIKLSHYSALLLG